MIDGVRSSMEYHNVPKNWWEYAVIHANEVINMLPTNALNNKTPNFVWSGKVPDVSKLRVFGCLAYVHLDGKKLPKLEPRAVPCIYLGNPKDGDGYKLCSLKTWKFIVNRSVQFFERSSAFETPEAYEYMKDLDPKLLW